MYGVYGIHTAETHPLPASADHLAHGSVHSVSNAECYQFHAFRRYHSSGYKT